MLIKCIKHFFLGLLIISLITLILAILTNVPKEVTHDDRAAFRAMNLEKRLNQPSFNSINISRSYDQEVHIIKGVQKIIFQDIKFGEAVPEFATREPLDVLRNKTGMCFDRSRLIEKALQHYGFETRHVYVLYLEGKNPLQGMLTYKQRSHALTEVKTGRGWMFIDSLVPLIGIDSNGNPMKVERFGELDAADEEWHSPYLTIRGLYSRKGYFYPPNIPFPDINWPDFLKWVFRN